MKLDYNFGKIYTPIIVKNIAILANDQLAKYGSLSIVDLHDLVEHAIYQSVYGSHMYHHMMAKYANNRPAFKYTDTKYGWIEGGFNIEAVRKDLCKCGQMWTYEIEVSRPTIINFP